MLIIINLKVEVSLKSYSLVETLVLILGSSVSEELFKSQFIMLSSGHQISLIHQVLSISTRLWNMLYTVVIHFEGLVKIFLCHVLKIEWC